MLKQLISATALLIATTASHADVLFENGTLNDFYGGNNPFSYNSKLVTEDFYLSSDAILRSLTFNAYTTASTVPVTDVLVKIFSNNNGIIGSELYSAHLTVAHTAVTGGDGTYSFTDYSVNLPNLALSGGKYWIGLTASPAQWDLHWSIISNASAYGATSSDGNNYYFRLENVVAVPEPETYALFLAGLGLMGAVARQRKANKTV